MSNDSFKNEYRLDRFSLDASPIIKTDEGFLQLSQLRATRVGVFKYMRADGTIRRELRHPDDVFKADSLATLQGKPITLLHPSANGGYVDSKNFGELAVGLTGSDVKVSENKFVDISGSITKFDAVEQVLTRKATGLGQELSCGYRADMVEESGTFNGEPYDCRQTNIRYNHVALVPKGRAGEACKVRLDADSAILFDNDIIMETPNMDKIILDGKEFDVSKEVAEAFTKHSAKHDNAIETLNKKVASAEVKADAAGEELEALKKTLGETEAKHDAANEELTKVREENALTAEKLDALAEERAEVIAVATRHVKEFKKDGKSNLEIKKETVAAACPNVKLDEKSEAYIEARFDMLSEEAPKNDPLKDSINQTKADAKVTTSEKLDAMEARKKYLDESREAYKKRLTTGK